MVTPAHQYPTGVTLHPGRRHAAIEWARAGDGLVIEDDYDGEFRYDRQPVGALQGMAPDHVAYVGTASKTLGPALRLGWMVLPERLLDSVVRAKRHTDLHTETIGQLTLTDLITSHAYDRHIRACRLRYRRRRDLLVCRLRPRSGQRFAVRGIAAGLHTMISLPASGPDEEDVLTHAAAARPRPGRPGQPLAYARRPSESHHRGLRHTQRGRLPRGPGHPGARPAHRHPRRLTPPATVPAPAATPSGSAAMPSGSRGRAGHLPSTAPRPGHLLLPGRKQR